MGSSRPYDMICLITRACDVLEPRWTIPILVSLWGGDTRFNDLRRSIGSISPTLLSRRLKEMEEKGLIERVPPTRCPTMSAPPHLPRPIRRIIWRSRAPARMCRQGRCTFPAAFVGV